MRRRRPIPVLGQLSPSEVCGHAAFFLSGTAFLEPEILQLRVLSVFAGGATLVFTYFHPIGSPLWLPFRWNVVFMLINSIYIYRILSEREHADRLPPQALELWERTFAPHGLSRVRLGPMVLFCSFSWRSSFFFLKLWERTIFPRTKSHEEGLAPFGWFCCRALHGLSGPVFCFFSFLLEL